VSGCGRGGSDLEVAVMSETFNSFAPARFATKVIGFRMGNWPWQHQS
jgi:hypothetical protein